MFQSPGQIVFTIGNVSIYYYGIIMGFSILIAVLTADFIQKKYYKDLPTDIVYDCAPYVVFGGIIGARLYYCLLNSSFYSKYPSEILKIWHGGLSIQGAILGGAILGFIYLKFKKISFLKMADVFSYGIILGQAIGRWGNFFNSEAFGFPCDLPWKLFIPKFARPIYYADFSYFHPTFLYESLADIIIFILLFFVIRKKTTGDNGIVFAAYLILYATVRIFIESIRIDSVLDFSNGLHVAQFACIFMILIGDIILISQKQLLKK